ESCGAEWKLVLVGDAAMHPGELLGAGDWEYYARAGSAQATAGIQWMTMLAQHFRRCAWLNPDPPSYWQSGTASMLSRVFPMFALTLDGLGEAIGYLSKGEAHAR